jgi:hypothetical protein
VVVSRARLYLNTFRGEPAISGFVWHFTPTLRSSLPFVTDMGSGLHVRVPLASPCPRVDHPVSGQLNATCRPFGLAFAPAPAVRCLNLATPNHSLAHSTKGTPSPHTRRGGSDRPEAHGFRVCFTPLDGVLFTVPSRYWFAIGCDRYLALGRGRPCFPPDSACPAVLTIRNHPHIQAAGYGTLTPSGRPFQQRSPLPGCSRETSAGVSITLVQPPSRIGGSLCRMTGLGSSRFARRYYGNPLCSSGYVRCFSSPGALLAKARCPVSPRTGCPIRRSQDHQFPALPLRISPRGRVLHRPVAPRHPPCAHTWFMTSRITDDPAVGFVVRAMRPVRVPLARLAPSSGGALIQFSSRCPPAHPGGWSRGDSNPGPPPCKGGALPAKLRPPAPLAGNRWARLDSNQGPRPYQGRALTT